jgi:hypothetical protein
MSTDILEIFRQYSLASKNRFRIHSRWTEEVAWWTRTYLAIRAIRIT